jgi:hypothetical protein
MTWSYDASKIIKSALYQVRYLIGDVEDKKQQMQDEELLFLLASRTQNIYGAAEDACRALAGKYAREVDSVQQELRTTYSERSRSYLLLATDYRRRALRSGAVMPYAGGISRTDKSSQEEEPDRVPPQFTIGQDDNYSPVAPARADDPLIGEENV